jgi:SHS2 domain-containing protein
VKPSHEFLDHVSETRLLVRAGSFAELLAEAGRGLASLARRGSTSGEPGPWREVSLVGADATGLLVDWLNELVYLAERHHEVPADFDVIEATERVVRARVRGPRVPEAPAHVKAATLHALRLERTTEGLEGEITLDV